MGTPGSGFCRQDVLLYEHVFELADGTTGMLISCDSCAMQHTDHCRDCVVMAVVDPTPRTGGIVVDADEERALRELAHAGLIPEIKMRPRGVSAAADRRQRHSA